MNVTRGNLVVGLAFGLCVAANTERELWPDRWPDVAETSSAKVAIPADSVWLDASSLAGIQATTPSSAQSSTESDNMATMNAARGAGPQGSSIVACGGLAPRPLWLVLVSSELLAEHAALPEFVRPLAEIAAAQDDATSRRHHADDRGARPDDRVRPGDAGSHGTGESTVHTHRQSSSSDANATPQGEARTAITAAGDSTAEQPATQHLAACQNVHEKLVHVIQIVFAHLAGHERGHDAHSPAGLGLDHTQPDLHHSRTHADEQHEIERSYVDHGLKDFDHAVSELRLALKTLSGPAGHEGQNHATRIPDTTDAHREAVHPDRAHDREKPAGDHP